MNWPSRAQDAFDDSGHDKHAMGSTMITMPSRRFRVFTLVFILLLMTLLWPPYGRNIAAKLFTRCANPMTPNELADYAEVKIIEISRLRRNICTTPPTKLVARCGLFQNRQLEFWFWDGDTYSFVIRLGEFDCARSPTITINTCGQLIDNWARPASIQSPSCAALEKSEE